MLGTLAPAGVGGGLGAALGQVGDVLSAPRRGLWSMLGLPEQGSELVGNVTGLDQGSALAQALGLGTEIMGDPLTYSGALMGPMARMGGRALAGLRGGGELAAGAGAASQVGELVPEMGRMAQPLGGFGAPKVPLPQAPGESQIMRELLQDAEQGAAREAAPQGMSFGQAMQGRPPTAPLQQMPLEHVQGQYHDLLEDLAAGTMTPTEGLKPRVEMLTRMGDLQGLRGTEARLGGAGGAELLAPTEHAAQPQMHGKMAEESALLAELLGHMRGGTIAEPGHIPLLRGVNPDEALEMMERLNAAHGHFLGGAGPGYTPGQGSQMYPRVVDAISGMAHPEDISGIMADLEGMHLPLDRAGFGQAFLDSSRENLSYDLERALRDIMNNQEPHAHSLQRALGQGGYEDALQRLQAMSQTPGFNPDVIGSVAHTRQQMNPLIEELMRHVQQRAGLG